MSTGIIDGFSAACFASMCVAIAVAIKLANDPRLQLRSDDTDIRPPEWVTRPKTGSRRYYVIKKDQ